MEHGQGDFMGACSGTETTTSSSDNQTAQVVDLVADGVSTDGEQLILGAHDDVSALLAERCFSTLLSSPQCTCAPSHHVGTPIALLRLCLAACWRAVHSQGVH